MQLPDGSRVSSANQPQQLCKIRRLMGHECAILRGKVHKRGPRLLSRFLQHRKYVNEAGVVGLNQNFSHIFLREGPNRCDMSATARRYSGLTGGPASPGTPPSVGALLTACRTAAATASAAATPRAFKS